MDNDRPVRTIQVETSKPILYCERCGSEYSANKGDYFDAPPGQKLVCCGKQLVLARRIVSIDVLKEGPVRVRELPQLIGRPINDRRTEKTD